MKRPLLSHLIPALILCFMPAMSANIKDYLETGDFKAGVLAFESRTQDPTATNADKFSLGFLHLLSAVEDLTQDLYRIGLDGGTGKALDIPFLRLPIPVNETPEEASLEAIMAIFDRFQANLFKIRDALKDLDDADFNVSVDIASVRIDLDGNGQFSPGELLRNLYPAFDRRNRDVFKDDEAVMIDFDLGDAYWLRGYSHLLIALTDIILAHNWSNVYDHTSHLFFPRITSPIGQILQDQDALGYSVWVDIIAGIHAMNMEVIEAAHLASAHKNFLEVIDCSRISWKFIERETDNLNEWIPSSRQTGINGEGLEQELIDGWKAFLDEFEGILLGEKLVPHWRFSDGRGINLYRVFHEPRALDVILWVHGSAAIPYLESGEKTTADTWRRILSLFEGDFLRFAIWVN